MATAPNLVVAGDSGVAQKLRESGRFPAVFDVASATQLRDLSKSGQVGMPAAFMFGPAFSEDVPGAGVSVLANGLVHSGFTVLVHQRFVERGDVFDPGVQIASKRLRLSELLTRLIPPPPAPVPDGGDGPPQPAGPQARPSPQPWPAAHPQTTPPPNGHPDAQTTPTPQPPSTHQAPSAHPALPAPQAASTHQAAPTPQATSAHQTVPAHQATPTPQAASTHQATSTHPATPTPQTTSAHQTAPTHPATPAPQTTSAHQAAPTHPATPTPQATSAHQAISAPQVFQALHTPQGQQAFQIPHAPQIEQAFQAPHVSQAQQAAPAVNGWQALLPPDQEEGQATGQAYSPPAQYEGHPHQQPAAPPNGSPGPWQDAPAAGALPAATAPAPPSHGWSEPQAAPADPWTPAMDPPMAARRGRVIVVASAKGGVGKTSMTVNLSLCASRILQEAGRGGSVVLVDTNFQQADVGRYLNLASPTVLDLMRVPGALSADRVRHHLARVAETDLYALLGPPDAVRADPALINSTLYRRIVAVLREAFDFVFIDTPVAEVYHTTFADLILPEADAILVPVEPNRVTLEAARSWLQAIILSRHSRSGAVDPAKLSLILNRAHADVDCSPEDVMDLMPGWRFVGMIPEDREWTQAVNNHQLMALRTSPEMEAVFRSVLEAVTGDPVFGAAASGAAGPPSRWRRLLGLSPG